MKTMPRDTTQRTLVSPGPAAAESPGACVVVIHGEGLGRRVDIGDGEIVVGRSHDADLHIAHPSVSRRHCALRFANGHYFLRDLGATNRTRVNDQPIDEVELADGDHIVVGESILKFIGHGSVEARYHEEVYLLATHDSLTGLNNRRHFMEILDREIARARHHQRPLTLAILDIDLFKPINDAHGHVIGDAVLKQVARVIATNTVGECIAARIGGEEFALLLPEMSVAESLVVAEAIRAGVAATTFTAGDTEQRITISIGVAAHGPGHDTRSTLLQAADDALYTAKESGRNQVCTAVH